MPRTESEILADGVAKELTAVEEELISIIRSAAHPDMIEKVRTTGVRDHAESLVAGLNATLQDHDEVLAAKAKYARKA